MWSKLVFVAVLLLFSQAQHNDSVYKGSVNNTLSLMRHYKLSMENSSALDYEATTEEDVEQFEPTDYAHNYETHLERSSVIFGLTKMANANNVSPQCHKQLKIVQRGILRKEAWAMKVLDASGTKPSGFMFGQNFWLGSQEACGAVQQPVGITLSKDFERVMHDSIITQLAPFDMNYRVVYLRHNSPWQVEIKLMSEQIIHIGLCLPSACDSAEIKQLTMSYVSGGLFVENDIYDIQPEVVYMKDLQLHESFYEKQSLKLLVAFAIFTAWMTISAALLRLIPIEETKRDTQAPSTHHNEQDQGVFTKLKNFAKCYDLSANYAKMFRLSESTPSQIPVLNGLRSVCAIWIMIFHVVWFMYFTVNNKTFLVSYAERVFFQYVSSAPLLVDVFFTISGFLQIYNFLSKTQQMQLIRENSLSQNSKLFLKLLFHRYLRLAPLYLVIMGVVDLLYAYMGAVSVYHIDERYDEICSQHWWRNLLFIQNLFDHKDMCLNWTWSLSCEMQFFIIATLLLFVYAKHPKFVKILVTLGLASTMTWTYVIGLNSKFLLSFDSAFATGTEIYISPFVRVMPYILGALAAWYFVQQQCQLVMSETKERCLWNLAILIFFSCIYSTIKRDMTYMQSISLFVFGRLFFSLSVCWIIVGSATGRGTWWSRMLEAKVFQHVNRLSYAIYLLNPFVIAFIFSFTSVSTHADPIMLCVLTSGFAVIVYLAAIVFSLAFEMPYCNVSSLLLRRHKQKTN